MTNLLSSNRIALPKLPSFSRRVSERSVVGSDNLRASGPLRPAELKRWIGRWENEGGAIVPLKMETGIASSPNGRHSAPQVAAMNAHWRASSDRAPREEEGASLSQRPTSDMAAVRHQMRSFLHLGNQYDTQARDNFTSEAVLFAVIVAAATWPIIHSVQAIAAMW